MKTVLGLMPPLAALLLAGCGGSAGSAIAPPANAASANGVRAAARHALVSISYRTKGTTSSIVTYEVGTGHTVRTISRSVGGAVAYGFNGFLYAEFGTAASPAIAAFPPKRATPRWNEQNGVSDPGAIVSSGDFVYVANEAATSETNPYESVTQYDARTGALVATYAGGVYFPSSVAADSHGNIYVVDSPQDGRVVTFLRGNPSPVRQFGGAGATQVVVDALGNVYVAQTGGIAIFAPGGAQTTGSIPYALPILGIAVDGANELYVASGRKGAETIDVYAAGGSPLERSIALPPGNDVVAMHADRFDDLYVELNAGRAGGPSWLWEYAGRSVHPKAVDVPQGTSGSFAVYD